MDTKTESLTQVEDWDRNLTVAPSRGEYTPEHFAVRPTDQVCRLRTAYLLPAGRDEHKAFGLSDP
jgi:hypothetical protein